MNLPSGDQIGPPAPPPREIGISRSSILGNVRTQTSNCRLIRHIGEPPLVVRQHGATFVVTFVQKRGDLTVAGVKKVDIVGPPSPG
jgi:hypothetical protein